MSPKEPSPAADDAGGPGYETSDAPPPAPPLVEEVGPVTPAPVTQMFNAEEVERLISAAEANASLATAVGLARAAARLYSTNKIRVANDLARSIVDELLAYADTVQSPASYLVA